MMKSIKRMVLLLMCSAIIPAASVQAQGHPPPLDGPPGQMDQAERENIRENIETLRMYKLLETLDLTSEQSTEFLPALKEFQDAKRKFQEDRGVLLRELEEALESEETDEKELEQSLTALERVREEFQAEFVKFLTKARATLTLKQRARLQLFEERFERRLRDSIRRMRGKEHFMEESR